MKPLSIQVGDILLLKKNHPCGGNLFKVLRLGSDLRIVCCRCGRDLTVARIKLEPRIKQINPQLSLNEKI